MGIPVIDFSKLEGSESERCATMAQLANGCEEWGFFQLVNHGISMELLERVKRVCSECFKHERAEGFKDSKAVQLLNSILNDNNRSTTKERERNLDDLDWEDVFLLLDDNQWPSYPHDFKETMKEYREELKKLAERVLEVMEENLGLERGYIKRAFCTDQVSGEEQPPFLGTKVSHYPPCPCPEMVGGLRAHTDAGGVILLFQDDEVGGLEILKEGKWVDVQPIPNAIVINIGDQIEVLTNGRYKSVWHRVLATRHGNRRSIASFYNPSLYAAIAPAPELVPAAYPRFLFGDYMNVYAEQKFLPKEPRFQAVKAL